MLAHQRGDRRDLDHLMAQRLRVIITLEMDAAAAALVGTMLLHRIAPLDRQQLRPSSWVPLADLPACVHCLCGGVRLIPKPLLEEGLEVLRELRPIRSRREARGFQLLLQLMGLLLLGKEQPPDTESCRRVAPGNFPPRLPQIRT